MKKTILQTFEDFLREPLSILKNTIIHITGIETESTPEKSITVENTEDGIQINVVNYKKAYKLLSSVMYKKKVNELRGLINENQKSAIPKKLAQPQIGTLL